MSRFSDLKDKAFQSLVQDVLEEYEKRAITEDNEDVNLNHISHYKDKALEIAINPYKIRGLATGYEGLDKFLCGLDKGELTAIAADTSVGKTLFTLNLINQAYKSQLFSTLYISLDTAIVNVCSRFFQMDEDPDARPIYFYDNTHGISLEKVKKAMVKCKEDNGLDLVVVDMLNSLVRSVQHQTNEMASVALKLRELALELNVHVIVLCHVTKEASSRREPVPHYSQIKDSSAVAQDSDMVIMLGRDNLDPTVRDQMIVSIQKNRNKGRTGNITMRINWQTLIMEEI